MTEVPGNEHFQSNVEFSNLVLCFFGRRYHLLVQIICFLAMQTTNIASIAVSAQLFDNLLIHIFHRTCGIQVYPSVGFVCVTDQLQSASPFTGVMIMTAGILLAFSMILPLGLLKLSENIWIQLVSFTLLILIVLQWIVTFFTHGLTTENVPAIGTDISQVFGTILFNYAFVTTVPSWANAKQPSVSIHKTVNWSVGITTFIYIVVAILGGMAYRVSNDSSLIQAIGSSPDVTVLSQITGYAFPIAALITSIPVNIIVIRYNLVQSGTCNLLWANLCAGVFPWLVAIPCMTGAWLTMIINWSSLFLVSAANFIIPFVLYICSKRYREKLRNLPIIEMEQRERLSREASRSSFSIRNASASGSVRRRITGSSFQSQARGHSHLDLSPTPSIGIAMASVTPVAVGIGSGGFVHPVDPGESQTKEHHRPPSNGPNSATEKGDFSHEPYFSFSRDGELFEHESSVPHSHSLSNRHHPTGSTVILHDPATEIAQRKSSVPRRVSHRDRILSIISDKHKRTMEQQAKIQEEQSEKPVPPIILLSQSIALESENKDDLNIPVEAGLYLQNNTSASSMSEKGHEKDSGMLNVRDQAAKENALESSPTLSSPGSPHKLTVIHPSLSSPERPSPDRENEPARLSASLSVNTSRDALGIESSVTDTSRLGPRTSMTSASARYPSGPESASSVGSVGRRVSFSGDHRLSAPMLSLERKPSFGDETKRLVKAVATLVGGSPVLGGSSHRSTSTKGKPLLGDQREAEEPDEDQDTEDADQDISSPRLTPGGGKHLPMSLNETRRDSMGRMAAAFVAQPGAFSIKTTLAPTEPSDATGVAQRYGDRLLEPPSLSPGKETAGALEESTGGDAGHIEEPKNHLDEFNADLYALENGLAYETRWGLRAIPKWIPASGLTVAWTSLIMLLIAITATITYDLVELSEGNNVLQG
ncbi:hypothetical protein BGX31_008609 [Mortierella sp. GBA43]|nr:hypothetical protein BGX31_008609 [Mortierella sp. GBA43]